MGAVQTAVQPRSELRYILNLAIPVILAELGWIFMGVVDTMMVGPLGPTAIGAVSIGNALFDVAGIFGIGLLLGLDTLISQAYGAGRQADCDRWLWQGIWLAAAASIVLMAVVEGCIPVMRAAGVQSQVLRAALPYLRAMNWSLLPLLLYAAFRRYLQSVGHVRPVMIALLSANVINALGNWLLIPGYGVEGSGWATLGARIYMLAVLVASAVFMRPALRHNFVLPTVDAFKSMLRLGGPAAGQILLEVGVFAAATTLAARLRPEALAAHHIALQVAGTTFMVPLGLSSAGAVAVGHALGAGNAARAKRAGWITMGIAAAVMAAASVVLFLAPVQIVRLFTYNTDVLSIAVPLLFVAAIFQIFDGIQVSATGILRGAGDTRTPMLANLVAHWALGLPAGYYICFSLGLGVAGLWMGLSAGLMIVAVILLIFWSRVRL